MTTKTTYLVPEEVTFDIRIQLDLLDVLCGEPIGSVTKGVRANLDIVDRLCGEIQREAVNLTLMLGLLDPLPEDERERFHKSIERTLERNGRIKLTRLEKERLAEARKKRAARR